MKQNIAIVLAMSLLASGAFAAGEPAKAKRAERPRSAGETRSGEVKPESRDAKSNRAGEAKKAEELGKAVKETFEATQQSGSAGRAQLERDGKVTKETIAIEKAALDKMRDASVSAPVAGSDAAKAVSEVEPVVAKLFGKLEGQDSARISRLAQLKPEAARAVGEIANLLTADTLNASVGTKLAAKVLVRGLLNALIAEKGLNAGADSLLSKSYVMDRWNAYKNSNAINNLIGIWGMYAEKLSKDSTYKANFGQAMFDATVEYIMLKKGVSREEAEKLAKQLKEEGCVSKIG